MLDNKKQIFKRFFLKRVNKVIKSGFFRNSGRNFTGKVSILHRCSGKKRRLFLVDYKRILTSKGYIFKVVKNLKKYIGVIFFEIGLITNIILPSSYFDMLKDLSYFTNEPKEGLSSFLCNFKTGLKLHNIEISPGKGAVLCRASSTGAFIYNNKGYKILLKLTSGKLLGISRYCIGVQGYSAKKGKLKPTKAGLKRNLGRRPIVRGVAKNPVDHPHGGGNGKKAKPVMPKTP